MLEAYTLNTAVGADSFVPFNSIAYKKGCSAETSGTSSISLNKCGVYLVTAGGSASAPTTIQLYKNGIAQPQSQRTGESVSFSTYVTVEENNTPCPCTSPTVLQVFNTDAVTFTDFSIVVEKIA